MNLEDLVDELELEMPMDRDDLLEVHKYLSEKSRDIMRRKNHDYTGDNQSPFANFTACEDMDVVSTEQGFLVRILDKLKRINTFVKQGELQVEDEPVEDAILDLINYFVLFYAYSTEKNVMDQPTVDKLRNSIGGTDDGSVDQTEQVSSSQEEEQDSNEDEKQGNWTSSKESSNTNSDSEENTSEEAREPAGAAS